MDRSLILFIVACAALLGSPGPGIAALIAVGRAKGLPQSRSGILDIRLDLSLLPTCGGIAELRRKDVVVRHREEADVDLPFLAAANTINRRLHVVVNAAARHAAEDPEAVSMGVEEHLVRLQQVGSDQKSPAMR